MSSPACFLLAFIQLFEGVSLPEEGGSAEWQSRNWSYCSSLGVAWELPCTPRQQSVLCTISPRLLFFVQNRNSNVTVNHLIEEELQSPNALFSGGLAMKSRCRLIQRHIDSDTGAWLVANKKSYQVQFSLGGSLEGRTTVNSTKGKLGMHKRYTCAAYSQLM